MNEEAQPIEPATSAVSTPLEQVLQRFQRFLVLMLVVMVGGMSALLLFLWRIDQLTRRDLNEKRPVVNQFIADYHKTTEPFIRNFTLSLQAFGQTNSDFNLILARYKMTWPPPLVRTPPPAK